MVHPSERDSSSEQIAVLDFGQNPPFRQRGLKSEISCSGHMNVEVRRCSGPTELNAKRNVPFYRCVTKRKKYVVSSKCYILCNIVLAIVFFF
jgi:hypothetical protein